jgi:hypothetical protein
VWDDWEPPLLLLLLLLLLSNQMHACWFLPLHP